MAKKLRQNGAEEIDEHDMPTEPLPEIDVLFPAEAAVPTPPSYEQPFPRQHVLDGSPFQAMPYTARPVPPSHTGTYPYLPAAPTGQQMELGQPQAPAARVSKGHKRSRALQRALIPPGVRLFFFAVQILLLGRFVVKLLFIPVNSSWMGILYTVSEGCLFPFRAFLPALPRAIPANIELYTLLAILAYNLLSRILRLLLKVFLSTR